MNQILPNLRIAFFCTVVFVAAALSPLLFAGGSDLQQVKSADLRDGLEIFACKR